jgi:hypothetical protein
MRRNSPCPAGIKNGGHVILPPGTDGRTFHFFNCRIARERTPMYTARRQVHRLGALIVTRIGVFKKEESQPNPCA